MVSDNEGKGTRRNSGNCSNNDETTLMKVLAEWPGLCDSYLILNKTQIRHRRGLLPDPGCSTRKSLATVVKLFVEKRCRQIGVVEQWQGCNCGGAGDDTDDGNVADVGDVGDGGNVDFLFSI